MLIPRPRPPRLIRPVREPATSPPALAGPWAPTDRRLDEADPKPGYKAFGGFGLIPSGSLGGWAPGKDILPDLVKNAQLDGKQYGIPWYAGVRAVPRFPHG